VKSEQAFCCDMKTSTSEIETPHIDHILPWLVEMGADELLHDAPIDRFAVPVAAVEAKPRPASQPPVNWKAVAAGAEGVAAAEALAASIESLSAYVDAIGSFDAHPLKKTASRACIYTGEAQSRVLLLCDKPRNEEDRSGEVLAGNNFVLTQRMLAAIGLQPQTNDGEGERVSMACFLHWRPPGNRAPTDLEAKMSVPLVHKLIALLQPRLILSFGHLPGQWLAGGEDAIFKSRGKWLDMAGIPMLTTFHPETLLSSAASKRLAWHDLQAFRAKLNELA
jgi:uracil-DNA glycosylase